VGGCKCEYGYLHAERCGKVRKEDLFIEVVDTGISVGKKRGKNE